MHARPSKPCHLAVKRDGATSDVYRHSYGKSDYCKTMADENITGSATGNTPDELPGTGEISPPATADIEGSSTPDLSQELADILSSFSPQKSTDAGIRKEHRKAPRFRVKWHADILIDEQSAHRGIINDISTQGASIYLNSNLPIIESVTLHIHVPPLHVTSKPHLMAVAGKIIYVVYDGNKQLFRAGVNFLRFDLESDLAYLGERLTKHHLEIPES